MQLCDREVDRSLGCVQDTLIEVGFHSELALHTHGYLGRSNNLVLLVK